MHYDIEFGEDGNRHDAWRASHDTRYKIQQETQPPRVRHARYVTVACIPATLHYALLGSARGWPAAFLVA